MIEQLTDQKTASKQHAQATYRTVNGMVETLLEQLVPYIRAGYPIPDNLACGEGWTKAESEIDAAVAADDLRRVRQLCAKYEQRAKTYLQRFENDYLTKATATQGG